MSNGSFLTSQLPVTTNAAGSDRLLVLWNAIANVSVGSGTPQTMMIGLADLINSAMTTIETDIMNLGTLSLGNSTINTVINSTSLYIQTNLGTVFAVNTAGAIVGNGAGITSLPAAGANSQILFNNSGTSAAAANLTWTGTTLSIGTGVTNTTVNSTVFINGNTYINSTAFLAGNSGTVIVGNVTYNVAITPQSITVSNNGNTMWTVTGDGIGTIKTQYNVGNSTANAVITPSLITISNSTLNVSLTTTGLNLGNSTINCVHNTTSLAVGVVGATQGSLLTNNALVVGNSTVNTTANTLAIYFQSNTISNSIHSNASLIFNSNATVNSSLSATAFSIANSTAALSLDPSSFNVVNTATGGTFNLPGGWHMAFGLVQTNTIGSNTITFANAFTSNAYSVTTQVLMAGAANSFAATVVDRAHVNSVIKTGFTLWTGNTSANASANVYYMAIGY